MQKYILLICSFLLASPLFITEKIINEDPYDGKEKFDISLSRLRSVDAIQKYIDSIAVSKHIAMGSASYAMTAEEVISQRFYHGYSHFKLKENWIAALCEKITGIGLSAKVHASHILKNNNAACSQQSIVLMEILRKKEIAYRRIGLPHHYVLEAKIKNDWLYLDPDMEPVATDSMRRRSSWKGDVTKLREFYPGKNSLIELRFNKQDKIDVGAENEIPATRVKIFQLITSFLSYTLWIVPLIILVYKRHPKQ